MLPSANNQLNHASIYSDLQSLDSIRQQAQVNERSAVKAAAKEFEAFFMNMMLKSMRQASEVIGEDSMFSSPQEKMFVSMLDEQMSVDLSQKGNLGIADLMINDLLGENNINPTSQKEGLHPLASYKTKVLGNNIDSTTKIKVIDTSEVASNEITSALNKAVVSKRNIIDNRSLTSAEAIEILPSQVQEVASVKQVEKKSLFDNVSDFINKLLPFAQKVSENIGVDPKLLLAQAALETGWGKYIMHDQNGSASHNLFGIKSNTAWKGDSVNIDTLEVENGAFVKKNDQFRMYENFESSFSDYVNFLQTNPRYQSALEVAHDAKQFIKSLQSAGYATDPNYAKKVLSIFNTRMNQE